MIDEVLRDNRDRSTTSSRNKPHTALHLTPGITHWQVGCRCDEMGSSFDIRNVTTWTTNTDQIEVASRAVEIGLKSFRVFFYKKKL